MTWTVANASTLAYVVIGKTMTIAFEIEDTVVGPPPTNPPTPGVYTQLLMNLPGGVIPTMTMRNQIRIKDNGNIVPGNATVEAGNGRLIFAFNDFTRLFTASSLNPAGQPIGATSVNGELTFEFK
jgi:hypothetical protein